jgi:cytochrome c biogenesis protein ResB
VACSFVTGILSQILGGPGTFTFFTSTTVRQDATHSVTYTEVHQGSGTIWVVVVGYGLIAALWVWLIFLMRRGANWARVVLTVLGGLGCFGALVQVLTTLADGPGSAGIVQVIGHIATVGFVVGALIAMYSQVGAYFHKNPPP